MGETPEPTNQTPAVQINGRILTDEERAALEQVLGPLQPGDYWYDAACGAWGMAGGPTVGFTLPNIEVPRPMPQGCSGVGTGTWINGREIHEQDRIALIPLFGACMPGRFWLDAQGNIGAEGNPAMANLLVAMQQVAPSQPGGLFSAMGGTVGADSEGGLGFYARNVDGTFTSWSN